MSEEVEAQRGAVTHLRSHSEPEAGLQVLDVLPKTYEARVWKKPAVEQGGTQALF